MLRYIAGVTYNLSNTKVAKRCGLNELQGNMRQRRLQRFGHVIVDGHIDVLWHVTQDKSIMPFCQATDKLWQLKRVNEEQYIHNSYMMNKHKHATTNNGCALLADSKINIVPSPCVFSSHVRREAEVGMLRWVEEWKCREKRRL